MEKGKRGERSFRDGDGHCECGFRMDEDPGKEARRVGRGKAEEAGSAASHQSSWTK